MEDLSYLDTEYARRKNQECDELEMKEREEMARESRTVLDRAQVAENPARTPAVVSE